MSTRSRTRHPVNRPSTHNPPKAPRRTCPAAVEALEDRTLFATFTVLNTLDDGSVGTLRWAIGQANAHAGADTIDFSTTAFATAQTINLASFFGGQLAH